MAKRGQVKVTVVGYYIVSDDQLNDYEIEEFDVAKMAKIDEEEYRKNSENIHDLALWFEDGRPTSVTFEPVDDSDMDPNC